MITQKKKKKVIEQFFLNFLKGSLPKSVAKNTIKKIGHRACLKDVVQGQTYPIYACTGANHARAFISSTVHF